MQRRLPAPLLLGVLLVLASLVALVYLGRSETPQGELGAVAAPEGTAAQDRPRESLVQPRADEAAGPAERVAAETSRETVETTGPVAQWDRSNARTVEGRVLLPADLPADERVEVVVLGRHLHRSELFHGGDFPKRTWEEQVYDRVEVTSDGTFRLEAPADEPELFLAVGGRYVYSSGSLEVTGEFQELPVEVGAWVVGQMLPPKNVAGPVDWSEHEARLDHDDLDSFRGGVTLAQATRSIDVDYRVDIDEGGFFEFRAVPANGGYEIELESDEFTTSRGNTFELERAERLEVTPQLVLGATLAGVVLDEEGAPVANAEVRATTLRKAFGMTMPGDRLRQTRSDDDGSFLLPAVSPGRVRVHVERDGFLEASSETLELADAESREDLSLTLSRGGRIAGTVLLPDGRPAAGAEVEARRDLTDFMGGGGMGFGRGGFESETTADERGRFVVSGLGSGNYDVGASYEEETEDGDERRFTQRVDGVTPDGESITIRLEPPITLRGLVTDAEGEPIEAFSVHARVKPANAFIPVGERREQHYESPDGSFEMHSLFPGAWELEVRAEGYSPSPNRLLDVPADTAEEHTFALQAVAVVAGRVVTPDGSPAAGAEVKLHLEMQDYFRTLVGGGEMPTATTEEDGTFVLDDMPAGTRSVVATHDDWAASEVVGVETLPGGRQEDVLLRLRVGALVTGEVYDKEGELAADQTIIMQAPTGRDQRYEATDADGFFEFRNVTPGAWQVIAMLSDGEEDDEPADDSEGFDFSDMMSNLKMASVEVADGDEEHVVLGAPPEDPVRVIGTVTASREPVTSAMVSFFPADGRENAIGSMKMAQTDDDGAFEVDLDSPGDYVMNVQTQVSAVGRQQTVEFQQSIPKKEVYELEVEMPGGMISGHVYGPDGEPMSDARISLTRSDGQAWGTFMGGQYAEITSDADGAFTIRHLREGRYSVGAGGSYFGGLFGDNAPMGRQVRDDIRVAEGEHVSGVDFHLGEAGTLRGQIVDAGGSPVSEATVFVRDDGGRLLEAISLIATDDSGRFSYTGLAEGSYTVTARTKAQTTSQPVAVEIRSGEETEATLSVSEGTIVVVNLVDKANEDVRGRITVTDPFGNEFTGMMSMSDLMSGMSGGFDPLHQRIGPLAPGTYKVVATAQDGRTAKKSVTLRGQDERRVTLRLRD